MTSLLSTPTSLESRDVKFGIIIIIVILLVSKCWKTGVSPNKRCSEKAFSMLPLKEP